MVIWSQTYFVDDTWSHYTHNDGRVHHIGQTFWSVATDDSHNILVTLLVFGLEHIMVVLMVIQIYGLQWTMVIILLLKLQE